MEIKSNRQELELELFHLASLFEVPDLVLEHSEERSISSVTNYFYIHSDRLSIDKELSFTSNFDFSLPELAQKSARKRIVKVDLYDALASTFGKTLPWGSLTGVRPTKFARDMIDNGLIKEHLVAEILERDYRVSAPKAKLVAQILKNQKNIVRNDNVVDLYINIPVCPSRCLYCSFISSEIDKVKDIIPQYLDCLAKEIHAVREIIINKPYIVRNIYIGGGTPSVLSAEQLERLLGEVNFHCREFTVECGRADTITEDKLDVLKKHGVTRISINPQTFCEATLKRIGRKHKNQDVFDAYSLALVKGFQVNMDIIAGLPGEKFATFKRTINTLLELFPDNITVHTLSLKRGAVFKDQMGEISDQDTEKMVDYAQKELLENGYKPYYIYRQKNQLKGLENVGYFRDDKICLFNIDSMEDLNTIIAVGAGALSKRVFNIENRIERQDNCKFIEDYIARIDEMIEKKREFFK